MVFREALRHDLLNLFGPSGVLLPLRAAWSPGGGRHSLCRPTGALAHGSLVDAAHQFACRVVRRALHGTCGSALDPPRRELATGVANLSAHRAEVWRKWFWAHMGLVGLCLAAMRWRQGAGGKALAGGADVPFLKRSGSGLGGCPILERSGRMGDRRATNRFVVLRSGFGFCAAVHRAAGCVVDVKSACLEGGGSTRNTGKSPIRGNALESLPDV